MNEDLLVSGASLLNQGQSTLDQAAAKIASQQGSPAQNIVDLLIANRLSELGGKVIGVQRQTSGRLVDILK